MLSRASRIITLTYIWTIEARPYKIIGNHIYVDFISILFWEQTPPYKWYSNSQNFSNTDSPIGRPQIIINTNVLTSMMVIDRLGAADDVST
jgi:hypothetical protein